MYVCMYVCLSCQQPRPYISMSMLIADSLLGDIEGGAGPIAVCKTERALALFGVILRSHAIVTQGSTSVLIVLMYLFQSAHVLSRAFLDADRIGSRNVVVVHEILVPFREKVITSLRSRWAFAKSIHTVIIIHCSIPRSLAKNHGSSVVLECTLGQLPMICSNSLTLPLPILGQCVSMRCDWVCCLRLHDRTAVRSGTESGLLSLFDSAFPEMSHK